MSSEQLAGGILIIDYGSQYTLLIARRIRELDVYCEIWPCTDARLQGDLVGQFVVKGVILSGGPSSVNIDGSPALTSGILSLGVPVLGICYGMQLLAQELGGVVSKGHQGEYGRTRIQVDAPRGVLAGFKPRESLSVWMSHGDAVTQVPPGFVSLAHSQSGICAAMLNPDRRLAGVQFHPEVAHTERGIQVLADFVFELAECLADWSMGNFLDREIGELRQRVGSDRVICGLSGGVDSTVVASLLSRAIGKQLTCVYVDTGLMRAGESEQVESLFRGHFEVDLRIVDASERFFSALEGVADPEKKRKIIGEHFIRVFEQVAKDVGDARYLAQGTLYPDVIESISIRGPSATIKSHHNVGGLPDDLDLALIEPLRELFKDEVRQLGKELGLPAHFIERHPFPGPGLAVRILGPVSREKAEIVRAADKIFIEMLHDFELYHSVWQAFAVLLPVRTVGVMGDSRTYDQVIALRAVTSTDGMTADRAHLPHEFLGRVSDRIINKVEHVNRVVYDITSKPPGTIEWE